MDTRPIRQSPRYAHEASATFHARDRVYHGRTINLSRGGLCAEVAVELPLGDEVEVDIELVFDNDAHSEALRVRGRVVWCTRVDSTHQIGLAFCHVRPEQAEVLSLFLSFLNKSQRGGERVRERSRVSVSVDQRFYY